MVELLYKLWLDIQSLHIWQLIRHYPEWWICGTGFSIEDISGLFISSESFKYWFSHLFYSNKFSQWTPNTLHLIIVLNPVGTQFHEHLWYSGESFPFILLYILGVNVTLSLTNFLLFHLSCVFSSEEMSFSLSSLSTDYKGSRNWQNF